MSRKNKSSELAVITTFHNSSLELKTIRKKRKLPNN